MNNTILTKTEITNKIDELIIKSNSAEVKTFFKSTIGSFFIDILSLSYETSNYSILTAVNELFFETMQDYSNAIRLANNLGYNVRRKTPARIKYSINIDKSIFSNVSKIVFKARDFFISMNGYNLYQKYDLIYNVTDGVIDGDNFLYEGNLGTANFTLNNFKPFNEIVIDSENISNFINGDSLLDVNVYSSYYQNYFKVIRDSFSEDDDEYICFAETLPNKYLKIIFGNDTLGKIPYGNIVVNYFRTNGATANNAIKSGEEFKNFTGDGIELYDNSGNILYNKEYYLPSMKLIFTSNLIDGLDFETKDEIAINSRKYFALNNTLNNKNDYEFYLRNKYDLNDCKVWASGNEISFRNEIDYSNLVLFSTNRYDYNNVALTDKKLFFNIKSNIAYTSDYNNKKGNIFEVVLKCNDNTTSEYPCISLTTLYLLGYFKPITLFYTDIIDYVNDTPISRIVNNLYNKSTIGLNISFIEMFNTYIDVSCKYDKIEVSDKTTATLNTIKDFNSTTNKKLSTLTSLINKNFSSTISESDISIKVNRSISVTDDNMEKTFEEYVRNNISNESTIKSLLYMAEKLSPNIMYELGDDYYDMKHIIKDGNYFVKGMINNFNDTDIIKLILNYYIKIVVYNVYRNIESKRFDLVELDYFNILISNITMIRK